MKSRQISYALLTIRSQKTQGCILMLNKEFKKPQRRRKTT